MLKLTSDRRGSLARSWGDRERRSELAERVGLGEVSSRALIAGLVAVGLLAWAAYQFGPELRRYMKMRSM